ncbi:MAG TPA: FAD:protein FMN transferase [Gemmatimonadales bacterium]|nr:FAD:protein FMN transferase [Gemmatimonadales bacterium]
MKRRSFLGALGAGVGALLPGPLRAAVPPYRPFAALRAGCTALPPYRPFIERWSWAMGQPVHLQLFADSESHGYDAAAAALAELRRVESRLTLFDDASDLVELNRHAGGPGLRVGEDLACVLCAGLRMEQATAGAFNPAIEPLMRAWGFHVPRATEPSPAEIREAREAVRTARIMVSGDRVTVPQEATRLDLGGIGVGYGLDRAASALRRLGIHSAFLDVSGDCIAIGAPPGQEDGWPVDIAGPGIGTGILATTRLRDAALATSANTMSVVRYGRAVRGHVMNPETGWPADALVQVSVVARTGIEADALSTAMLVSGEPAEGVLWYQKA